MSIVDAHAFYGEYIRKAEPAVRASLARMLESERNENSTRANLAEGEVQRAHLILDELGAPRLQPSGFPCSLEGRLRNFKR
jgi:hypothetical protein